MARIPDYTVDDFIKITRFPIREYLADFVDFIAVHRVNIINYYSGRTSRPFEPSFRRLTQLLDRSEQLNDVIEQNKNRFRRADFWELQEKLSDIRTSLWTVDNTSKWVRSAITKNNFNPQVELDYVLQQYQTLERLADETIGASNKEQYWVQIALRNDIAEEDYTPAGGTRLSISMQNGASIQLRSVVDNIAGEKVYGLDIDREISFADDDLSVLSYKDTIQQAVEILAALKQGDNPEFPDEGIQSGVVVGSNRNAIAFPILMRQYYNTFSKDDTLRALKITRLENAEDRLLMEFTVETRIGEEVTSQILL